NMEELGGRVLVFSVDIADYTGMQEVLNQAGEQFGPLNGVIHSAGVTRGKSLPCPIGKITREDCQEQFQS
ncbi:MAG: SDR family oxidoreductase, partial [Candidatus Aminicenantes bacterium]|nr:SDR family oxidoreductase [Candidatus Aminicenantes bacterium]NIQ69153.1 SDR family oxidoreductase [Candidatus Aminicenantes bacterium]NIT25153.1 SDR family oxidoreductase [Candidatus Aminicenantes bacterium]